MTIGDYIRQKFQSFGYQISEADLLDMTLSGEDEINSDNKPLVDYNIVKFIPSLLMRANVSESGFSFSYDKDGIIKYYSMKCKEFGIEDLLTDKPRVTFL